MSKLNRPIRVYKAKPRSNIKSCKSYSLNSGVKRIQKNDYTDDWRNISSEVKARDNYACVDCRSTKKLDVHHILPLSRGGSNRKCNLITLCEKCHKRRHKHL